MLPRGLAAETLLAVSRFLRAGALHLNYNRVSQTGDHVMSPTKRSTSKRGVRGRRGRKERSGILPLQIQNRTYAKLSDQPLFITPELKSALEKRKFRSGIKAYDALVQRGFRGGKHLIELIREQLGKDFEIVLSHEKSALTSRRVTVNFEAFREAGQQRFFEVYRQTGIRAATEFLNEHFPERFTKGSADDLPETRDVKRVLKRLPDAADVITKKDRRNLPEQIAALVEKQGVDFAFDLLSSVDGALPRGQERIRGALRDVVKRLAQEPAKALTELADLMGEMNLLQLTSLLSVLRTRLQTIEAFEELIHDETTYELKEAKSIHRTLERSMWLLNDEYWIAQSNRSLRTFIGKELRKDKSYERKRPDFACVDSAGRTILVEIKRPSLELGKKEIDQAELYLRIVKKYTGSKGRRTSIFLIGNTISGEARELADMRGYPALQTYQEMVENARRRYQEYLRIVEAEG
jgi:hypothetical protein